MSDRPPAVNDWGWDVWLARTKEAEQKYLNTIAEMREHLDAALVRRETFVSFELPVMAWVAVLDEIENQRPRNLSQLMRDDTLDRLNEAIDRLHDEANFLIASGPGDVAARIDPARRASRRDVASPELRRKLREDGPK
jgi:hypothetical protein